MNLEIIAGAFWIIIFTTIVQFLEVMFGGGTRGARRMHNLANSLVIFDGMQCLPVNCVHLFNNGLQILVNVFPNAWKKLEKEQAVRRVQEWVDVYYLDERYYSKKFGVSTEVVVNMGFQNI